MTLARKSLPALKIGSLYNHTYDMPQIIYTRYHSYNLETHARSCNFYGENLE